MKLEPWLVRAARARPDHEALRSPRGSLTYSRLLELATGAAGALAGAERVGIALPPGEDFAVALHGCLLAGVPAVPIDLRLSASEQQGIAAGCDVVVDGPLPTARRGAPAPHDVDAPAIVVHTSGTSGTPKAVELTYGNWLWSALGAHASMGLRDDERWLCALPLSHVGGLSILLRSAIYGTTAIVHERFDTDRVLAELRADATVVSLVPTTLARLLDAGLHAPPALRCALIGGAPIPPALVRRAREAGVPTSETYGLTEACSQVTTDGRPLFCTQVDLAPDHEILVSGPTVAPGAGPVLNTGDLGTWDAGGRLVVTGRKADTIVTGGENVAPTEVEEVLAEHAAVAEAAVHGRPDPEWGEALVAAVVLRVGAETSEAELQEHCRARLAPFKVPKAVAFVESLPRTRSGKLIRSKLT
jgi:O-succinylbenzoic acid--CoA ligase